MPVVRILGAFTKCNPPVVTGEDKAGTVGRAIPTGEEGSPSERDPTWAYV